MHYEVKPQSQAYKRAICYHRVLKYKRTTTYGRREDTPKKQKNAGRAGKCVGCWERQPDAFFYALSRHQFAERIMAPSAPTRYPSGVVALVSRAPSTPSEEALK